MRSSLERAKMVSIPDDLGQSMLEKRSRWNRADPEQDVFRRFRRKQETDDGSLIDAPLTSVKKQSPEKKPFSDRKDSSWHARSHARLVTRIFESFVAH